MYQTTVGIRTGVFSVIYRKKFTSLRIPLTSICNAGLAHLADLTLLGSSCSHILSGATLEEKVSLRAAWQSTSAHPCGRCRSNVGMREKSGEREMRPVRQLVGVRV